VGFWFSKLNFFKITLSKVIESICGVFSSKTASTVVEFKPLAFRVSLCHMNVTVFMEGLSEIYRLEISLSTLSWRTNFSIRQPVLGREVRKTFSYANYQKKASLSIIFLNVSLVELLFFTFNTEIKAVKT